MKRLFKDKSWLFRCGAVITAVMTVFIVIGLFWTPYDPNMMDETVRLSPPSLSHPFGTDNFGRDILSRTMQGAGTTFLIALLIDMTGLVTGTVIGALSGYFGGWFDTLLMRVCDAITAFPSVMLALVIIAVLGSEDTNIVIVLGILFIPGYARIVRSEFVQQKEWNYVKLARLMGAGPVRIMTVHILPNIKTVLLSAAAIGFNNAVLAEASMSFLGIGVSANKPSLGRMLMEAQSFLISGAPWYAGFVGLVIVLLVLGLSLLGEGLEKGRKNNA